MKRRNKYFNRELSWLQFNDRVLNEASDSTVPLLEKLKFLSITASNLDEFFMVRVGGLELLSRDGVTRCDPSGMSPAEQLKAIQRKVRTMYGAQYSCFKDKIVPGLEKAGIVEIDECDESQASFLAGYFEEELFPLLTPARLSAVNRVPTLSDLRLHIAVRLSRRGLQRGSEYAVIPISSRMQRFITVPSDEKRSYIRVERVVMMFVDRFFPGEKVLEVLPFRVTRNADVSVKEDLATDFLAEMRSVLNRRKDSDFIRLEVDAGVSKTMLSFLMKTLKIESRHLYLEKGPLDLSSYMALAVVEGFDKFRYQHWSPKSSPELDMRKSIFDEIKRDDILLYHPYDSFDPVIKFIEEAAEDKDVLAIKQTLYRTSSSSPIIRALKKAAKRGKYVTVVVELKARFDEARNIEWASELERSGVQVIYGIRGLKTHSKICIVVRREQSGIIRYMHFGTGNYNEKTAGLYSDISFMTRDPLLGSDSTLFFNSISGYSEPMAFAKLTAAPTGLRTALKTYIESETERSRQGQKAHIMAKMNSLVDPEIIELLYEASRAGVKVELNIRGICCLVPGVKKMSENITVTSIIDRFLEHSRIFYFLHGGDRKVFISSADWMPRNIDRRIELMVPVESKASRRKIMSILKTHFKDNVKSHELLSDGNYVKRSGAGRSALRSQEYFCNEAVEKSRQSGKVRRMVFEVHKAPGETG